MIYDAYNTDSAIWIFILLGAAAFVYKAFKEDDFGAALSAPLRVIAVLFGAALLIMLGVTFIGIALEYTHWVVLFVLALIVGFSFMKK